jgi:hypothetical protein
MKLTSNSRPDKPSSGMKTMTLEQIAESNLCSCLDLEDTYDSPMEAYYSYLQNTLDSAMENGYSWEDASTAGQIFTSIYKRKTGRKI